jgi:UDP-N-acetylmuramate dehydrogenase
VIEENVALARYTTIGTGGPARLFARPSTLAELREVLQTDARVEVVGLGSNLLVPDHGVDALVL